MSAAEPPLALPYADRREAGCILAARLTALVLSDPVVLALPRGGVPVAAEVARVLRAPLDVLVVRKLGVPSQPELAFGALAGDVVVYNEDIIRYARLGEAEREAVLSRERAEAARRLRTYRGERPPPAVAGRTVILVDDGLATGATMRAAVAALRSQHPARVVVAVPVASREAVRALEMLGVPVVTPAAPADFGAVGRWYRAFPQVADAEVKRLLDGPQEGDVK